MNVKKILIISGICLFILLASFGSGYLSGYKNTERKYTAIINQYQSRLADIENLNRRLQDENSQLTELNRSVIARLEDVTGRLSTAKDIISGFSGQITTDGETIQRIIENFQRLELAISKILEVGKN